MHRLIKLLLTLPRPMRSITTAQQKRVPLAYNQLYFEFYLYILDRGDVVDSEKYPDMGFSNDLMKLKRQLSGTYFEIFTPNHYNVNSHVPILIIGYFSVIYKCFFISKLQTNKLYRSNNFVKTLKQICLTIKGFRDLKVTIRQSHAIATIGDLIIEQDKHQLI